MSSQPDGFKDKPVIQTLKIVDVIDCVAGNAPDADGRPITILTLSYLGELEQSLALSYEDTKLLVTKLLQSLADHGNGYAEHLLGGYLTDGSSLGPKATDDEGEDDDDLDEGEAWKEGLQE